MSHSRAARPDLPHRIEVRVSKEHLALLDSAGLPTRSDTIRMLIEKYLQPKTISVAPGPNPG